MTTEIHNIEDSVDVPKAMGAMAQIAKSEAEQLKEIKDYDDVIVNKIRLNVMRILDRLGDDLTSVKPKLNVNMSANMIEKLFGVAQTIQQLPSKISQHNEMKVAGELSHDELVNVLTKNLANTTPVDAEYTTIEDA